MFPKKVIFNLLFFAAVLLPSFSPAFAEILFQDNFDNSPDWQSKQTVNKSQSDGYDISFGQTRSDTCTTNCPPQGWTSYRTASSFWTDDRRKDTYVLSSEGARGGSGKGITYNVEVSGSFGTWAGGSLDIWLGETGYKELFVRYYIKFDPSSWKWTTPDATEHHLQKLIRINTFNDDIRTTSYNPQQFGTAGRNWPVWLAEVYYNKSSPPAHLSSQVRQAPNYTLLPSVEDYNASIPSDGEWHYYEYHVKMNSAPGIADGIWGFYIDGVLKSEKTNVVWKKANSDIAHNWNWLMLLDNVTNASTTLDSYTEMQLYMDDVVVSTSYIGPGDQIFYLAPPTF